MGGLNSYRDIKEMKDFILIDLYEDALKHQHIKKIDIYLRKDYLVVLYTNNFENVEFYQISKDGDFVSINLPIK